jgi:hypothetical protein
MKRASYRDAIDWIAQNDSAGDDDADDPEVVGHLVSSVLIAEIFGVECERVGRDVVRRRSALDKEDGRS